MQKIELILLLLMAIMASLGCSEEETMYQGVDPEFQEYVDAFWIDAAAADRVVFHRDIPINFHSLEGQSGVCLKKDGQAEILIDPEMWESRSIHQKKALIYHELGHCILDRPHDHGSIIIGDFGYPTSLMSEDLGLTFDGSERDDFYIEELFSEDASIWNSY